MSFFSLNEEHTTEETPEMTVMPLNAEQRISAATVAWHEGARRRRRTGIVEGAADALLAGGGLVMANATMSLELGLPAGRAGLSLGIGLASAGAAWIMRHRARKAPIPAPAVDARILPAEAWRAA